MGQYFKFVNPERKEWIELPSMLKLPEMMGTPMAARVVMYMLFEGPFDGTTLLDRLYDVDDPKVQTGIAEMIVDEADREYERFQDHDRCNAELSRAIRDVGHDAFDPERADIEHVTDYPWAIRQDYARRVGSFSELGSFASTYRNDDGTWNEADLQRVVCAGFTIGEDSVCGRWAGDPVRIVGDYAETDYYSAMYGTVVVDCPSGETVEWNGPRPRRCEPTDDGRVHGTSYRRYDELASTGETVKLSSRVDVEAEFGTFVRYEATEWTDITDDVVHEMARYMPDEFAELLEEETVTEPETVFGSGQNTRA
jgi:hypothetical protein